MKANDIAAKALSETKLKKLQWMALSRIRRGETIRLEGLNEQLMDLLKERATELETAPKLEPTSVTDWMALALFADNRRAFALKCLEAERNDDKAYRQAAYWLNRLMKQNEQKLAEHARRSEAPTKPLSPDDPLRQKRPTEPSKPAERPHSDEDSERNA